MTLVQVGGGMSAQQAGLLTLGYAIAIVAFIRVGEKLLQRFGPRRPMIWGSLIVGASILLLMPTNVMLGTYKILAIVAFTLFGIGLAFYATPSTDAALSNLPDDQAGSGLGHLQDGVVAGRVVRRRHLGRDLHGAERATRAGGLDRRRHHLCRPAGQRRPSRGGTRSPSAQISSWSWRRSSRSC